MITINQLANIYHTTPVPTLERYLDAINKTLDEFNINTEKRIAMFLANLGVESRNLQTVTENLNYRADRLLQVFPRYFNRASAAKAAGNPQMIANIVYANRLRQW